MEFMETFEELRPGIVGVSQGQAEGTGFVVGLTLGGRATVVTSAELTDSQEVLVVDLHGQTYTGTLVEQDADLDLAVVRICCSRELTPLPLGLEGSPSAGEFVFAARYTPGTGIATFGGGEVIETWVESDSGRGIIGTDAPVEFGNTGRPLIGADGRVAGIVTLGNVLSETGEAATGESFAVEADTLWNSLTTSHSLWGTFGEQEPSLTTDVNASTSGKPTDKDAIYGGILEVAYTQQAYIQDAPSFNTWEGDDTVGPQAMQPLHNMLIQPRTWVGFADEGNNPFLELSPDLAEGWRVSTDGLELAFSLRDGLEWSDGTPLTCDDVKWSFDTIRTGEGLEQSPHAFHFRNVETITCADDLTVVFVLNDHHPTILEAIALPQNIIRPAHVYAENDFGQLRDELPSVTSGPFQASEWIPGEGLYFERNDYYWDEPFPYLDGVELHLMDRSAITTAMRTGRIHIGSTVGFAGSDAETLAQECANDVCQFWDQATASSLGSALFVNQDRELWNDSRVSEAIALAIDNQLYIDLVKGGWGGLPTGCGFRPSSEWAMPAERCGRIAGYGDFLGRSTAKIDKQRASRLLADAGYEHGELELVVSIWSEILNDIPLFSDELDRIGLRMVTEAYETRAYQWALENGDFQIAAHRFEIPGLDPNLFMYELFHTDGSSNYGGYSNSRVDDLIDRMSTTLDFEERRELAWDAMEIALSEQAKIIMAHDIYQPITSAQVRGFMPGPDYMARYGPQNRYDRVWLAG